MKKTVLFDMDGVLANFAVGSLAAHGQDSALSDFRSYDYWNEFGMSAKEFWGPLENPDFWENLGVHADGIKFFVHVENLIGSERIGFLSSGLCPGSVDGKRRWLDRNMPGYARSACFLANKGLVSGPGKILIDDYDGHAGPWTENGGQYLLVPRPWNSRRHETDGEGNFCPAQLLDELKTLIGEG